jgi:hypothetical protein
MRHSPDLTLIIAGNENGPLDTRDDAAPRSDNPWLDAGTVSFLVRDARGDEVAEVFIQENQIGREGLDQKNGAALAGAETLARLLQDWVRGRPGRSHFNPASPSHFLRAGKTTTSDRHFLAHFGWDHNPFVE